MYAAVASRGDISFAVGMLSRYLDKPTKHLWSVAMRVLRYLAGTATFGPVYSDAPSYGVEAFSDSDWSGCQATRRSTSGSLIQFGGGSVIWMSQRQSCVSLSSMESEIVACSETGKSCLWLTRLLNEIGYSVVPRLRVDNL